MDENKKDTLENNDANVIDASHVEPASADDTNMTPAAEDETTPVSQVEGEEKKSKTMTYVIAAVIVVGVLGMVAWMMSKGDGTLFNPVDLQPASVIDALPEVVAVVNGVELSKADLAESIQNLEYQAQSQGVDPTTAELQSQIQEQALAGIVNTALLIQAAAASGLEVSDDLIDAEVNNIVAQLGGEEAFAVRIEELGLEVEDVREDISNQLLIDEYIANEVSGAATEVSDEDIQAFYDNVAVGGQELPPLEEVSAQIEAQLTSIQQQELVSEVIENLRQDADINVLF